MKDVYRFNVWGSVIPIDTKFRDASKAGLPLPQFAPNSRGSQSYGKLLDFLLGIEQRHQNEHEKAQQSA